MKFTIFAFAAWAGLAQGFTTSNVNVKRTAATEMHAIAPLRQAGAAFLAASTILSNVIIVPPQDASAADSFFTSSATTEMIAARSGGRAGGRSSAPRRSAATPTKTKVIERQTTVIQQAAPAAPMYMAPPSYGYAAPAPSGLGLAIGLNAVSGIASGMREARQESEIRSTRDQLTEARIKEAEMEARLRGLEQQQMMQQMQK